MPETEQKAYRLAGICKKCHEFRFGYLIYGHGPFICYQCAAEAAKNSQSVPGTTVSYFSFTTSNSSNHDSGSNAT